VPKVQQKQILGHDVPKPLTAPAKREGKNIDDPKKE
jgi:hypothetical protein